jgi:uncharacterized membrane protein YdfJ with MMPL/SSD domain
MGYFAVASHRVMPRACPAAHKLGTAATATILEPLFQMGFVIAVGLIADTFLVRALLVPAVAVLLGERNWWPSRRAEVRGDIGGSSELLSTRRRSA